MLAFKTRFTVFCSVLVVGHISQNDVIEKVIFYGHLYYLSAVPLYYLSWIVLGQWTLHLKPRHHKSSHLGYCDTARKKPSLRKKGTEASPLGVLFGAPGYCFGTQSTKGSCFHTKKKLRPTQLGKKFEQPPHRKKKQILCSKHPSHRSLMVRPLLSRNFSCGSTSQRLTLLNWWNLIRVLIHRKCQYIWPRYWLAFMSCITNEYFHCFCITWGKPSNFWAVHGSPLETSCSRFHRLSSVFLQTWILSFTHSMSIAYICTL